ncbi:hypothetical protein PGUG_00468 [Meyerozyma guilliermondii ATCC 6260]|uniref:Uncharacterized protein n=1 Tax=Meyerozyma guilliermondii (strain ATCC 6260 / CBS 566 / DSM 6381 / JCM 1539 / NBRC 10279 / NRRL Y-324) TaxID=294746 RepID=A5DB13_PICGU|nr:uncharacterized protein PGUG_00468 [Meyerozyma guilliermondii ATCC 6260]EDK36371.2 hypothetical protein PGUG_00468 [Meyerozyma guilliermondii ATCC 6260]
MALCSSNHFSEKVSSLKDIEICAVVYRSLAVIRVSTSHTDTKTQQPLHCSEYLQGRTLGRNSFTGLGTVTVIHTTLPINLSGSCLHGYFTFSSLSVLLSSLSLIWFLWDLISHSLGISRLIQFLFCSHHRSFVCNSSLGCFGDSQSDFAIGPSSHVSCQVYIVDLTISIFTNLDHVVKVLSRFIHSGYRVVSQQFRCNYFVFWIRCRPHILRNPIHYYAKQQQHQDVTNDFSHRSCEKSTRHLIVWRSKLLFGTWFHVIGPGKPIVFVGSLHGQ